MKAKGAISEFDLIRRHFTHPVHSTVLGVGDDAAILRTRPGHELVVSADMLVAGTHFFPDANPLELGHKALAVNLSDIAAMGGMPRWATLALALPRVNEKWLAAFSRGFMSLARLYRVDLVGGDTTRGPLNISVQIMGEVRRGRALRRDGARPRDDIWVSGHLGDAALAVAARKKRIRLTPAELRQCGARLDRPEPRVALGLRLSDVAHSAIDISDGLLADLGHIIERSGVAAEIEFHALPVSSVLRRYLDRGVARRALLAGGDDYELCFTAAPGARERIVRIAAATRIPLTRIGRILPRSRRSGLLVRDAQGEALGGLPGGYDHFR